MENEIKPGHKEELTDLFGDVYQERDDNGQYAFRKDKLLKFNYEGSITTIRVTKVDRKNKRMWGVHVKVSDMHTTFGHYGHNLDTTDETLQEFGEPYCTDCEVVVSEPATEDGEFKAKERADRTLSDGTEIPDEDS